MAEQHGIMADDAVGAEFGKRWIEDGASAVGVFAHARTERLVNQTHQRDGQEMGADQAVEQDQVKQNVDLSGEFLMRSLSQVSFHQGPEAQKQAVYDQCVQIDEHDGEHDNGHAAKIAQGQAAEKPVRRADSQHQNDTEHRKKQGDLPCCDPAHDVCPMSVYPKTSATNSRKRWPASTCLKRFPACPAAAASVGVSSNERT